MEFAGVENDGPSKNRGWNLQDWKMTDEVAGVEFARLESDGLKNDGLEIDGVEQELHPIKNFNVYDIVIVSSINLKTYIIPHLEIYLLKI